MPVDDSLARTVLKNEATQREEQQRLKKHILAAAADHEAAPRQYIDKIRQTPVL